MNEELIRKISLLVQKVLVQHISIPNLIFNCEVLRLVLEGKIIWQLLEESRPNDRNLNVSMYLKKSQE